METAYAEYIDPNELRGYSAEQIASLVKDLPQRQTARIQCVGCDCGLPLRMSDVGERAARWQCAVCGVPFAGIPICEQLAKCSVLVRLDDAYFTTKGLPEISSAQRAVVARIAARARQEVERERRRSPRVSQSLIVPAVTLGSNLNPVGRPMKLLVSNISPEGIGLVHTQPITRALLVVELLPVDQPAVQMIVKLIRCRPLQGHLYELGGEFVARLGNASL